MISYSLAFLALSLAVNGIPEMEVPEITPGEVGGVLFVVGVCWGLFYLRRRWIKRKGYRMILEDRNDKMHALLLRILQDGIDDALLKEEISHQEARNLFKQLGRKGFRDLVPKKQLASEVKARLKSDRLLREKQQKEGKVIHPVIPGGPPTPIKKQQVTVAEKIGKTVDRFWSTSKAS